MGIESEYGLMYAFSEEQLRERKLNQLPPQIWGADPGSAISRTYEKYLPEDLPRAGGSYKEYLGNGMRLYQDVGSHPEVAGAETTDIQEIIDGDLAADKLLFRALRSAYLDGAIRNFVLLRRVISPEGITWGRHESYHMDRERLLAVNSDTTVSQHKLSPMVPFLAVRSMMGGAGCLYNGTYWMGQKLVTAVQDKDGGTTRSKPLVNTRDEPHGDGYRHHVVCVDFTSPEVTARNMQATSLVARMIEHGKAPQLWAPYPNWAFFGRYAATDLSMTYAATVNGKSMTGLNVHEAYLEHADAIPDELLSPAEQEGREKWHAMYDRLVAVRDETRYGDPAGRAERLHHAIGKHLVGHVDWADRLHHIGRNRADRESHQQLPHKQHTQSDNGIMFVDHLSESAKADIDYDTIGRGTGMNRAYVNRLKEPTYVNRVDQRRIAHRMLYPPAMGRAALRGQFLHDFKGDPNTVAGWSFVGYRFPEYGQLKNELYHMKDPEASEDAGLEAFKAKARRFQERSRALRAQIYDESEAQQIAI